MTVADLIAELQRLPQHAEARVAMRELIIPDIDGDHPVPIAQTEEAQPLDRVVYEGGWVGLYA